MATQFYANCHERELPLGKMAFSANYLNRFIFHSFLALSMFLRSLSVCAQKKYLKKKPTSALSSTLCVNGKTVGLNFGFGVYSTDIEIF